MCQLARLPALMLALAAGLALNCGPGAPSPQATQGERRIVSLSPSITRVLLVLGARDDIVGVDLFSRRLPDLEGAASLGGLFTPDLERTIELRPTLILAVESAHQQAFFGQVRARGVRVETFDGHRLDEVLQSFRRIGALVGRADAGEALAARVERQLRRLAEDSAPASGAPRPSVAVIVERDPLYVVGGGSFVGELIELAGGRNSFADLDAPYPRVSLEALAERAPDVLIDTTYDASQADTAGASARAHWRRFGWVRRVEALPQGILTLPGPELPEAAALLRDRIQARSAAAAGASP